MIDVVVAEYDGQRVLAVPVIPLDVYLSVPRHARWPFYLAIALACGWP